MKIKKLLISDIISDSIYTAIREGRVGQVLLQLSDKSRSLLPMLPIEIKPGLRGIIFFLSKDFGGPFWLQGIIFIGLVLANFVEILKIAFLTIPITLLFGWPWLLAGSLRKDFFSGAISH